MSAHKSVAGFTLATMAAAALPGLAAAQDAATFFKDKQIRLVVGIAAGSGYDINARTIARHLSDHIPGKPTVIVQNQPGAGSVTMTQSLYRNGPKDGTAIGASFGGMPATILLSPPEHRLDLTKINWLGSSNRETHVTYVWHTAPIQSIEDLKTTQIVTGAQAPGTTQFDFPMVANAILGTRFKVVSGYDGTPKINLAMESGEVQGNGATAWTSVKALVPSWITEKKIRVIGQWSLRRHPDLPDVPLWINQAKTDADRQALKFMLSRLEYGRPFFLPPDVPADRVEVLRRAFDATMKDPAFLAEAAKAQLEVDPMTGEEVAKLVAEDSATPPAVLDRIKAALDGKS